MQANDYTVEITQQAGLEASVDTMSLRLLTHQRAHKRPQTHTAPSMAQPRGPAVGPRGRPPRVLGTHLPMAPPSWLAQPNKVELPSCLALTWSVQGQRPPVSCGTAVLSPPHPPLTARTHIAAP